MKKNILIVLAASFIFFSGCIVGEKKNISLMGSTWISTNENLYGFTMVSFIDDKIAYIVMDDDIEDNEGLWGYVFKFFKDDYFVYDSINVGTRTVSGKIDKKEWKFTYSMENENLNLTLPKELNKENYNTIFSKRLVGNNISQPTGLWTNDTGIYFIFTNSDSRKKFGLGTYVSWDYTFDNKNITWSGNKGAGTKPYVIDENKRQIRLVLPGNDFPITLTNVSDKFITIF